jgi:hypothetical protein
MSHDDFQDIRAALQFHPSDCCDNDDLKEKAPLYHSRMIQNHFLCQCVSVAVPCGTSAHDENNIQTSAQTRAKHYMDNKPIKYAL